ncbi:Ubiquitin thioesterase otubain-like [Apostasia shenzhenica]|uniref:Ubiquitin thioesterase otubain-like n=1 Tax=Apostasia shenzhenica TaxID=1088818 RepID=A0A2H9ZWD4_9ASPA|nr:Ubiquitin thioesterase otubain-like [Apostasia shenzhenica]
MGMEVDNMQIGALVDALGIGIRIEYVCGGKYRLNHHDFGMKALAKEPYVTLLYMPGHYEIFYNKKYDKLVPEASFFLAKL